MLLTLEQKNKKLNKEKLLLFLLKYKNSGNNSLFREFLFQSCELGNLNCIKLLLDNGMDINQQNELGETLMHISVAQNDYELTQLLVSYNPDLRIKTKEEGLTVEDYVKIRNDPKIKRIIKDLKEKKKIKSEIINFIREDMNILNNKEFDIDNYPEKNKSFLEIENYEGEKIIQKNDEIKNKKSLKKNSNNIITNNKGSKLNQNLSFLVNTDFNEAHSPKNAILIADYNNLVKHKKHLTENPFDMKITKEMKFSSPPSIIKKDEFHRSISPSCVQSLKTAHTLNKEFYEASPLFINKRKKSADKKDEFIKFMLDINLPKAYAKNLINNGFDDLEVLILQEKSGTALTNQNLKDIGIMVPGDRAKILVHLEELSGNLQFLEKNIIYSNIVKDLEINSLYKFLSSIHLQEYFERFEEKGYYNAELLYTQMMSKYPITEDILKNDFEITKIGHINRIIQGLNENAKKYFKTLQNKVKKLDDFKPIKYEYRNPSIINNCETCMII